MYRKVLGSLLLAAILLASIDCSGGNNDNQKGDSGSSKQPNQTQKQGSTGKQEDVAGAEDTRTVRGVVAKVNTDKNLLLVKPRGKEKPRGFRITPEHLKVTLNGKESGIDAIEKGQQVAVKFVPKTDKGVKSNVARKIRLNPAGGGEQTGPETT
jgi:hypothetical protein